MFTGFSHEQMNWNSPVRFCLSHTRLGLVSRSAAVYQSFTTATDSSQSAMSGLTAERQLYHAQ